MSAQLPEGHATLRDGDRCPLCNAGVLYKIAETADGWLLKCFNCDRSGSVHRETGYLVQVPESGSPAGFTQTAEQLAASGQLDTEQAAQRARETEPQPPHPNAGGLETPAPDQPPAGTGQEV
jgi:hypothetical protein